MQDTEKAVMNVNRAKFIIDNTNLTDDEKNNLLKDFYAQPVPIIVYFGLLAGGALIAFGIYALKNKKFAI